MIFERMKLMPGNIEDYEHKASHIVLYVDLRKRWEPRPLDTMVSDTRVMLEIADSTYLTFPTPEVGERLIAMIREGVKELRQRQQPGDVTP